MNLCSSICALRTDIIVSCVVCRIPVAAYSVCADDSDSPVTCESLTVSDKRKIRVPVLNLGLVALLGSGIKNVPLRNPAGSVINFLSLTFALAPELCPTRISFGIGLPAYAPRA